MNTDAFIKYRLLKRIKAPLLCLHNSFNKCESMFSKQLREDLHLVELTFIGLIVYGFSTSLSFIPDTSRTINYWKKNLTIDL